MERLNQTQIPNAKPLLAGTAQNLMFRFRSAKPFAAAVQNTPRREIKDKLDIPWLTSVSFSYKDKESFVFEECIMSISLEKNIVSTPLQGRNGTIKEYITQGDYNITMAAAVSNYQEGTSDSAITEYPGEKIEKLKKLLDVEDSLVVQSQFLAYFDIHSAVIQKFSLTQETHSNRQSISITMLSDTPYEIKLKQEKDVKTV